MVDPGGDARRMEAGDGPLWIVSWEPIESPDASEATALA
jgi:hypothetical protein